MLFQNVKGVSSLPEGHDFPDWLLHLFGDKQQRRRVSWDDPFTDCHMEDLLEIPSKVSDQAKGIAFCCSLIKNPLKIIPIDAHQVASREQGNHMILKAILIGHSS